MINELRIEANKACNFRCDHCYTSKGEESKLPVEVFETLIRECCLRGVRNLSITGGEPLLPTDVERSRHLIAAGRAGGMSVRLNSNGYYLNATLAETLRRDGLHEIQLSLSSASQAWFDAFTHGKGALRRVLDAIGASKSAGLYVSVRFTLMASNQDALVPTFHLVRGLGIDKFKVRTVVQVNGIRDSGFELHRENLRRTLQDLQKLPESMDVQLLIADDGLDAVLPERQEARLRCKCGADAIFVGCDGEISPCPFLREDPAFRIGNLQSDDFFSLLENSDQLASFIGEPVKEGCGNCCRDACRASQLSSAMNSDRSETACCDSHTMQVAMSGACVSAH